MKRKVFLSIHDKELDSFRYEEFECKLSSLSDFLEYHLYDFYNSSRYDIQILLLNLDTDYKLPRDLDD